MFVVTQSMVIGNKVYEPLFLNSEKKWSALRKDAHEFQSKDEAFDVAATFPKCEQFRYEVCPNDYHRGIEVIRDLLYDRGRRLANNA